MKKNSLLLQTRCVCVFFCFLPRMLSENYTCKITFLGRFLESQFKHLSEEIMIYRFFLIHIHFNTLCCYLFAFRPKGRP